MDVTGLSVFDAAREAPDHDALVAYGQVLSWRALAERVSAACTALDAVGFAADQRVAVRASNRVDTVVVLLAFITRGIPFVPIHPRSTPAEAAALIAEAEVSLDLDDASIDRIAMGTRALPSAQQDVPADALLAMIHTSGTTGRPRGALLTRSAFAASAAASALNLGWKSDDRWLACMPLCHIGGLSILTRCLIARKCMVLQHHFDPRAVLEAVVRDKITLASVVPTMLQRLLVEDGEGVLARLRAVLVGGAAAPPVLMIEARRRGIPVLATYGLTEACSQVTSQSPDGSKESQPGSGRPLKSVELSIVDDTGRTVEPGDVGRIRVRGPSVMKGYWCHPPLADAWLETGDLGAMDPTGTLHVHARRTDLIVTGGENVYPAEVEQGLDALPSIARAMVFGVDDPLWGQVVAAALVAVPGVVPDEHLEGALVQALAVHLAVHKRPRRVCWVEDIPMRSSGKADRAAGVSAFGPRVRPWLST